MILNLKGTKLDVNDLSTSNLKALYKEKGNRLFCYCKGLRKDWNGRTHINFYESWNYADEYNSDTNSFVRNFYIPTTTGFIEFETHVERNVFRDLFYSNAKNSCPINPLDLIRQVIEGER